MKGSVKLFIASLIVLACSIGFFAGSIISKPCPKAAHEGMMPPPPPGPEGKHGPKGPHDKFDKRPSPEFIDSLLQVTAEQKAALNMHRQESDAAFKDLHKAKWDAEKQLGEALDSGDSTAIDIAKNKVLEANKAMLDHRIKSMTSLNKILTPEQQEKFRNFHKEQMKKHKGHKGPKGPRPEKPQI